MIHEEWETPVPRFVLQRGSMLKHPRLAGDGCGIFGRRVVQRLAYGIIVLLLIPSPTLRAQTPEIDALKGKIFDARMAQQTFANALKYCDVLDGKNFYYQVRNRLLNLEEYLRSLENLAKAQVFNPEKKRPWSLEDAKARWEEVKKQAQEDKEKCELVKSLPDLEKQLQELQQKAAATNKTSEKSD